MRSPHIAIGLLASALLALSAITELGACTSQSSATDAGASGPRDGQPCASNAECDTGVCIAGTCGFSTCSCTTTQNQTLPGILPDQTTCKGCPYGYACANDRCFQSCAMGASCAAGRACASPCVAGACCPNGRCSPANNAALCTLDVRLDTPDGAVPSSSSITVHATAPSNAALKLEWIGNSPNVVVSGDTATVGPVTPGTSSGGLMVTSTLGDGPEGVRSGFGFVPGRLGVAVGSIAYCLSSGAVCTAGTTRETGGCCAGACAVPDGGHQTVCMP